MFTTEEVEKSNKTREPKRSVFSLRVTEQTERSLFFYANNYHFEIYEPIRRFITNELLPAFKKAAEEEDEKRLKEAQAAEDVDKIPDLESGFQK
jgi:hypothetical protein